VKVPEQWVYSIDGKEVVFTGDHPGYDEAELAQLCLDYGAGRVSDDCNLTTNLLVRGRSGRWKYGQYGKKEAKAARMQADGRDIAIIDLAGLLGLVEGVPAPALPPNVPEAPARAHAAVGGVAGAPYRGGQYAAPVQGTGVSFRDPDRVERGLRAHTSTQDGLRELLDLVGYEPLRAFDRTCNYDIGWHDLDGRLCVAEVKSLTTDNEAWQVRHGIGQVLDYALRLERRGFVCRPYVVVEKKPSQADHWQELCQRHGVVLTWAPDFPGAV
jgi:hypothetical protein